MDGDALVVENASSLMLLTRIEWFADFSEDKVEALRQAVEQLDRVYDVPLEQYATEPSKQRQRLVAKRRNLTLPATQGHAVPSRLSPISLK